jgi:hypothetical protein
MVVSIRLIIYSFSSIDYYYRIAIECKDITFPVNKQSIDGNFNERAKSAFFLHYLLSLEQEFVKM